jgi:hypothetical protein
VAAYSDLTLSTSWTDHNGAVVGESVRFIGLPIPPNPRSKITRK